MHELIRVESRTISCNTFQQLIWPSRQPTCLLGWLTTGATHNIQDGSSIIISYYSMYTNTVQYDRAQKLRS